MIENQQITQISEQKKTIGQFLMANKSKIESALPSGLIKPERMLSLVMTEIRKNKKLSNCTHESLIGSVINASQLGLEIGSGLGHCWLIPYENKRIGAIECQFQIGYKGMLDLVYRSGKVISVYAMERYKNDQFSIKYGTEEECIHIPTDEERGEIMGFYAVATLSNSQKRFEYMRVSDIDKIREKSKSKDIWASEYIQMGRKTVIKRLCKYLPISIEVQRAIMLDNLSENGDQQNGRIFENSMEEPTFSNKSDQLLSELG